MLPNEVENCEAVSRDFGNRFSAAAGWLALSVDAHDRFAKLERPPELAPARAVISTVLVQCMRRFRAMIALCQLAYPHEAIILLRALFEAHLALRYIVKDIAVHAGFSTELKAELGKLPPIPPGNSAPDFRALLYLASGPLKHHLLGNRLAQSPSSEHILPESARDKMDATVAEVIRTIGNDWAERIRATKSYSGIRQVALLAEFCGQAPYYKLLYGIQSSHAHGEGATAMINGIDGARIAEIINIGGALLGTCIEDMNDRFGLSLSAELTAMTVQLARFSDV